MDSFEFYLARERNKQDARDAAANQRKKNRQLTREERKRKSTETMVKLTSICFALIIAFGILATVLDL
jgi:hypothetical protein